MVLKLIQVVLKRENTQERQQHLQDLKTHLAQAADGDDKGGGRDLQVPRR